MAAAAGSCTPRTSTHTAAGLLARALVERSFADRAFLQLGHRANEAALKFARKWQRLNHPGQGRTEIVAFAGSFHGALWARWL